MAVSSDDKLRVYNEALRHLNSRELASLSEDREPVRVLNGVWGANNDIVSRALRRADWKFARRSVESAYDADLSSGFGFRYSHAKPGDCERLSSLSADEYFRTPLTDDQFSEEAGAYLTDEATLYIRYVSSGDAYGLNSGGWSEDFIAYLAAYLAAQGGGRIAGDGLDKKAERMRIAEGMLTAAASSNSIGDGVKFPPSGSWIRARSGSRRNRNSGYR